MYTLQLSNQVLNVVKIKDLFGNVVQLSLFKYCENTCEWKSVLKIRIVLFT